MADTLKGFYLPTIILEEPKDGSSLRYFECPNCGMKWISDYQNYEIANDPVRVDPDCMFNGVEVFSACPTCRCKTYQSFRILQSDIINMYKNIILSKKEGE